MSSVVGVKNSRVAGSAAQVDMETIGDACVLEAVASACQQRARAVGMEIRHGLTSLASVSVTAPLLGLIGTVYGITNSFHSIGGSRSTGVSEIAQALSESLVTTEVGLFVAVFALGLSLLE